MTSDSSRRLRLPSPGMLALLTVVSMFVVFIAVPIGWRYHRQQALIEHIESFDGGVETAPVEASWIRNLIVRAIGDEKARGFDEIVGIYCPIEASTSETLQRIGELSSIRELYLVSRSTENLDLRPLSRLKNLEELSLLRARFDGEQLRHLAGLTALRRLDLRFSRVGDRNLNHLASLEGLTELRLGDSRLSREALEGLRSSLPNCSITNRSLGGIQTGADLQNAPPRQPNSARPQSPASMPNRLAL